MNRTEINAKLKWMADVARTRGDVEHVINGVQIYARVRGIGLIFGVVGYSKTARAKLVEQLAKVQS